MKTEVRKSICRSRSCFYKVALVLTAILLFGQPLIGQAAEPQGWNVVLLIDQSNSMFQASDVCNIEPDPDDIARPVGLPLRQWGAVKFIDYLGVDPVAQDQIAIIYFGTEPGFAVGENRYQLFPATDLGQSQKAKTFLKKDNCPPAMSWTNTNKALEEAYNELVGRSDGRQKVVILLTDGKPELAYDWPIEDTFDDDGKLVLQGKRSYYQRHFELIDAYKEADIKLFIMALGENAQLEDPDLVDLGVLPIGARKYRDLWDHAAAETDGEYYKVERNDQLWTTYHAIAAKLQRVFPGVVIGGPKGPGTLHENFQVPESARMIVTVERDVQTISTLFDPDGFEQMPTRSDEYYQIYNFENPKPGRWTLRFEGPAARYSILIDFKIADLNIETVDLPQVHPVGKPLPLRVRITDDSGAPLEGVLVGTTVEAADGSKDFVSLVAARDKPGIYEGEWEGAAQVGDYDLLFQANQGGRTSELEERVTLDELLYLELIKPQEGEYVQEAEVRFALKRGQERVPVVPTGDTTLQLDVTLYDSGGKMLSTLPLSGLTLGIDNVYSALFEDIPGGKYAFSIVLNAPDEGTTDKLRVSFHLTPPPTPTPTPTITPTPIPHTPTHTPTVTPTPTSPTPTHTPTITPTPTPPTPTSTPTPPPPEEPICLQEAFGLVQVGRGETFQLAAPMDTSELVRPVVVNIGLNMDPSSPIELNTRQWTLKEGASRAQAELSLAVGDDDSLKPGKNTFQGSIAFSVQDRAPFCTMSLSVEVQKPRMWIPKPSLKGKAGKAMQVKVEYDTSGRPVVEPVQVALQVLLEGVPSDAFAVDQETTTLTPLADKRGTLSVPIHIDKAAAPDEEPRFYQGKLVFTYPDGTQDVSEFSLNVVPQSLLDRWWPLFLGLAVLMGGVGAFIVIDPLCLRCKLSGKLVYVNLPEPEILLRGNRHTVVLSGSSQPVSGGPSPPAAMLVVRARKKQPPVVDIKQAADRVTIDGQPYQEGDKSISLKPDMVIQVGSVEVKYEALVPDYDYDYDIDSSTEGFYDDELSSESMPLDEWPQSAPLDAYDGVAGDSLSVSPYDQPPTSSDGEGEEDAYGDLDY